MTKVCSKCKKEKEENDFVKDPSKKDGLYSSCKECNNRRRKGKYKEEAKEYREKNKIKIKENRKRYYEANKEKEYTNHKEWLKNNREVRRKHFNDSYERNKKDPLFRLKNNIRSRVYLGLKSKYHHKDNETVKYIGCSFESYKEYIESLFIEGMSWNNYGKWHIDHIKPIDAFSFEEDKQIYEAFNFKNTQPLWAEDNLRKGSKWDDNNS